MDDPAQRPDVHLLRELRFEDSQVLLTSARFHQVGNRRLYHTPSTYGTRGGRFTCVDFVIGSGVFQDVWSDPDVRVSVLFTGNAAFDGVRHLWWTPESDCGAGYVYYPGPKGLAELLAKLDELFPDKSW